MAEWPDDKVTDMVALRRKGWSATQIGFAMGVTRNAIIGKLDRLGLIRRRHDRPVQKDTTYVASRRARRHHPASSVGKHESLDRL